MKQHIYVWKKLVALWCANPHKWTIPPDFDNANSFNWSLVFLPCLCPLFTVVSLWFCSTPWWTCCLRWWWVNHTLCAASNPMMTGRRCASARRGWWCSCATQGSWRQWTSVGKATPTASCSKSLSTGKSSVETGATSTLRHAHMLSADITLEIVQNKWAMLRITQKHRFFN